MTRNFRTIYGVDFSGAKLAGRNIWVARLEAKRTRWRLVELSDLQSLCGVAERDAALEHLVDMILRSQDALWAIDFPFSLPPPIMNHGMTWAGQIRFIQEWREGAYELGLWCVSRARELGGPMHIRRTTDRDVKTPFDCYHYRIIYQTFHGMRDVLGRVARGPATAVLPFQYARLARARRAVVEACPSSTLKRLRLPHQNYKQVAGQLAPRVSRTRRAIVDAVAELVQIDLSHRRRIMRNPGGDALDAVLAGLGAAHAWRTTDHVALADHPCYPNEGYIYA